MSVDQKTDVAVRPAAANAGLPTGLPTGLLRGLQENWAPMLRPRMALMVFLVAWLGGVLALASAGSLFDVTAAAFYVTLIAGAASVFNQVIERETDALMPRTADRPLVIGTVAVRHALLFGLVLAVWSVVGLWLSFNLLSAFLALATLFLYVAVYTPLKRVSTLNTVVGAVAGAAPPLIAYVAIAGAPGSWGWLLFAVLFAWQFPHFMAIAWLYRDDYSAAGMRMLPSVHQTGGVAGRQAVLYAVTLLPVSLLPLLHGMSGVVYGSGALTLGLCYLVASIRFRRQENVPNARFLLHVSLAYLPLLFASILLDPIVRSTIVP